MWQQQQWRPDFLPERLESSQELELDLVLRQGNQSSVSGGLCIQTSYLSFFLHTNRTKTV